MVPLPTWMGLSLLICIPDILNGDQLHKLVAMMDKQRFIDGRETAGWAAAGVKENRQVAGTSRDHGAMQALVTEALAANRFFALDAMPRMIRPVRFRRYPKGMGSVPHFHK